MNRSDFVTLSNGKLIPISAANGDMKSYAGSIHKNEFDLTFTFRDTLDIIYCHGGAGRNYILFKSNTTGANYEMQLGVFFDCLKRGLCITNNQIAGEFKFIKKQYWSIDVV